MKFNINQNSYEMPAPLTLAQALAAVQPTAPFAVAVNRQFVAKAQYPHTELHEGDQIELITPVVGG